MPLALTVSSSSFRWASFSDCSIDVRPKHVSARLDNDTIATNSMADTGNGVFDIRAVCRYVRALCDQWERIAVGVVPNNRRNCRVR